MIHRVPILLLLSILLTFSLAAQTTPYAGVIQIPGRLQVENYDLGGEGIAWHDTTPGNAFGVYRTNDMDVGQISATEYHIGALEAGEWAKYSVQINAAGTYTVTLRWASAYTGTTTFRLRIDDLDIPGGTQSATSTGSWSAFTTKTFNVTLNNTGAHILKIDFITGFFNPDYLDFSACAAPTISGQPQSITNADPNSAQKFTVTASGTGLTYQWLKNGVAITGNPSATTSQLTVSNVEQYKDGGSTAYSVRVTNSCGVSVTSNTATMRVWCGKPPGMPGWVEANIGRAYVGPGDLCDWPSYVNTNFGNDISWAGSYNIAPLAAAVAYIKQPVKPGVWDMNQWWTNYLQGEVGDRGAAAWTFGGKEFGSYVYQEYNETAVLAVHYQAHVTNNATIEALAKRWLRAAVALHAIAGMPQPPLTFHANGLIDNNTSPYDGPYTSFAGDRSGWGFWSAPNRNILMARALGLFYTQQGSGETSAQKTLRQYVEGQWPDVYGLTATEKAKLSSAISSECLPSGFVATYLGNNLRTSAKYHIVGWSGGVKATLMEASSNNNTAPTFGAVYFKSSREAHFLYPWGGVFDSNSSQDRNGICNGTATLDLAGHTMTASHPNCTNGQAFQSATIDYLPAQSALRYHVILDPNLPPAEFVSAGATCP